MLRACTRCLGDGGRLWCRYPRHTTTNSPFSRGGRSSVGRTSCHAPSLHTSVATIKSRSLSPDDPFGERSSWEDPSDGVYAAWKSVDQEGFVTAAESAEVRNAHFGPEWSRFTTVGRLSVRKMQEDPRHHNRAEGEPSAYPSAEDVHDRELQEKKRIMSHNYATYEEYLAHEFGDGGGVENTGEEGSSLREAAVMEEAFAAVEGVDSKDRMARRNPAREALASAGAAEDYEEEIDLPNFILETAGGGEAARQMDCSPRDGHPQTNAEALAHGIARPSRGDADNSAAEHRPCEAPSPASATTGMGAAPLNSKVVGTPVGDVPKVPSPAGDGPREAPDEHFIADLLGCLPSPHIDVQAPLKDPIHWHTEHILSFLTHLEQRAPGTPSCMDDSMVDAFHLAKVDGEVLLNVVTPPTLFRVMRRWHTRRLEMIARAWKERQMLFSDKDCGPEDIHRIATQHAASAKPMLDEAAAPVTPLLIQETILLCFPYAR